MIRAVLEIEFSTEMFTEYDEGAIDEVESGRDLYIKWTAEYKFACSKLYKNTISRKHLSCSTLKPKGEISSPF